MSEQNNPLLNRENSKASKGRVEFTANSDDEDETHQMLERFDVEEREGYLKLYQQLNDPKKPIKFNENRALATILTASIIVNPERLKAKQIHYNSIYSYNYRRKFLFNQQYLRISFIGLITIAFVISFLIFMPVAQLFKNFNYRCPLYAFINYRFTPLTTSSLSLVLPTTTTTAKYLPSALSLSRSSNESTSTAAPQPLTSTVPNVIMEIDDINTTWGPQNICQYCISVGILTVCYCVISLFFFIMFNMKDLVESDFCLLIPWVTLTSIFTLMVFIGSVFLTHGFATLCEGLVEPHSKFFSSSKAHFKPGDAKNFLKSCRRAQDFAWMSVNNENYYGYMDNQHFYDYLIVSVICSWILFLIMVCMDIDVLIRIFFIYKNYNYEQEVNDKMKALHSDQSRTGSSEDPVKRPKRRLQKRSKADIATTQV